MIVPCSSAISGSGKRGQTQKIKIGPPGDEKGGLSTGGNKADAAILWWGGANAKVTLNSNPWIAAHFVARNDKGVRGLPRRPQDPPRNDRQWELRFDT